VWIDEARQNYFPACIKQRLVRVGGTQLAGGPDSPDALITDENSTIRDHIQAAQL
jgi:hypothetical protein